MDKNEFNVQLKQFERQEIPGEFYVYDAASDSTISIPIEELEIEDSQELEFIYDETVRKVWNSDEQDCFVLSNQFHPKKQNLLNN